MLCASAGCRVRPPPVSPPSCPLSPACAAPTAAGAPPAAFQISFRVGLGSDGRFEGVGGRVGSCWGARVRAGGLFWEPEESWHST